jgi:hypothetical protein
MRTHEADWFPIIFTGLQAQRKWALGKKWLAEKQGHRQNHGDACGLPLSLRLHFESPWPID